MSTTGNRQRILVGIDLSAGSRAAAELTTEVASALGAEVCGLFVEEDQLLILAANPLVREIDTWSATERMIDTKRLERRMRAQGYRARELLVRLAERRGVPCTFRIVRGPATAAIRSASSPADIVTLGRVGWSPGQRRRLGGTVRALLSEGDRAILIPGERAPLGAPIVVCFDGSAIGVRALHFGANLARSMKAPLVVELLGNEEADATIRARSEEILATGTKPAPNTTFDRALPGTLPTKLRDRPARLVVLAPSEGLDPGALAQLAVDLPGPVLVISSTEAEQQDLPAPTG